MQYSLKIENRREQSIFISINSFAFSFHHPGEHTLQMSSNFKLKLKYKISILIHDDFFPMCLYSLLEVYVCLWMFRYHK